jgi:MSHA biogenesis protein MshQ
MLTTSANPSSEGTINPASEWVNSGTSVPISATANPGDQFTGFSGALSGTMPQSLIMTGPASVTANFSVLSGPSWYSSAWTYRKLITINSSQVSGSSNLTNFPVLISLGSDANLSGSAQASGNDILFTDSSGTNKLNHQIETYVSGTGQLVAWVEVPSVSPTTNTGIYLYYGNASATNQQNTTGVWDSNYKAVYHFANGSTLSTSDSTANGANLITGGSPSATNGQISGAISFSGTNYAKGAGGTITGAITMEGWFYPKAVGGVLIAGDSGATGAQGDYSVAMSGGGNLVSTIDGVNDFPTMSPSYSLNAWNQFAVTADGSHINYYINGALAAASSVTREPVGNATYIFLGQGDIFGDSSYVGNLDEIRISSTARSAGWIGTEYNNQKSPLNFSTLGSQQTNSGAP